jgi:ATP-dependent RNA helicase RhlE
VEADAIHGNKSQNARTRALADFKEGSMRVLVATDIAARGLDIEALPHVVNYDLPHVAEDYVHRIGRTGRAGSEGEAISLVCHEDRPLMAAIERLMNRKVESRVIQGFEPGSAPAHRDEQPRSQHQQHRRPQQQGRRGQQPQRNAQPQQQRRNGQQHPRGNQPQRPQQRPVQDSAYEDQIREARARMREEGENVPAPAHPQPHQHQQQPRNDGGGRRRGRRGRGGNSGSGGYRSPARSSRDQQWDPRRSEPREPAYMQQRKPDPSRPAPVVQVKQRRTLSGFVGALLGRKKDEEKS